MKFSRRFRLDWTPAYQLPWAAGSYILWAEWTCSKKKQGGMDLLITNKLASLPQKENKLASRNLHADSTNLVLLSDGRSTNTKLIINALTALVFSAMTIIRMMIAENQSS